MRNLLVGFLLGVLALGITLSAADGTVYRLDRGISDENSTDAPAFSKYFRDRLHQKYGADDPKAATLQLFKPQPILEIDARSVTGFCLAIDQAQYGETDHEIWLRPSFRLNIDPSTQFAFLAAAKQHIESGNALEPLGIRIGDVSFGLVETTAEALSSARGPTEPLTIFLRVRARDYYQAYRLLAAAYGDPELCRQPGDPGIRAIYWDLWKSEFAKPPHPPLDHP